MSRIGSRPITIPDGIKVEINGSVIKVEGKGKVSEFVVSSGFQTEIKNNEIIITRPSDSRKDRSLHGTFRSLVQNIITGLKDGFVKKLQLQGVGYKAQMKGKTLVLDVGFSHSIKHTPPEDVTLETPSATEILVKGVDKQKVGEVAAEIRDYYPPEPYKGKGIRYEGEYVRHKQGKSIA
ncbi:MAG: 50S ribosomal protein L6 [Candidatus Omnitrophica bacterium]|nr:50S ribosomal protein L6 [Candidatus Omnitrophota bacterium]